MTDQNTPASPLCRCVDVAAGTFTHTVLMVDPFTGKQVGIDVCIATEIAELWHLSIRTMASCCGHGKYTPSVSVLPEHDPMMPRLGFTALDLGGPPVQWRLPATPVQHHPPPAFTALFSDDPDLSKRAKGIVRGEPPCS